MTSAEIRAAILNAMQPGKTYKAADLADMIDGMTTAKAGRALQELRKDDWVLIAKPDRKGNLWARAPVPERRMKAQEEHAAIEALLSKCRRNNVHDHPDKRTGIMARVWG